MKSINLIVTIILLIIMLIIYIKLPANGVTNLIMGGFCMLFNMIAYLHEDIKDIVNKK
jgi:hypothetical protein